MHQERVEPNQTGRALRAGGGAWPVIGAVRGRHGECSTPRNGVKDEPISDDEAKGVKMATQRETDEAAIRQRIEKLAKAISAMDIDGVMSSYAPDLASFDLIPPLRPVGAEAKRRNWEGAFAMFQPPLHYEVRDLTITVGDDVAFGHSLNRLSATSKDGKKFGSWVRFTGCFRKIDGNWLIVHDHVSVPLDPPSGKALMNLEP
jgi:ketosteroid isomerase-like protein